MSQGLMSAEDRELFATTLAQAIEPRRGGAGDDVLAELGWIDLLDAEPRTAIGIVFGALGRANVSSSCLSDVVATAIGAPAGSAVVLPAYATASPPGHADGADVVVDGVGLADAARADVLLVPCAGDTLAEVAADLLAIEAAPGTDPTLGLCRIRGRAAVVPVVAAAGGWDTAVEHARLALAHEVVGSTRTMLELGVDHARGRVQFGRAIGSFQAVRHKLAETLVAVESADAALDAAEVEPGGLTAALAKALAGRAAITAGAHVQQVLAGIGFTREHEFHRHLLRTIALDGLFGSTSAITREIGAGLLANRAVPKVIQL